MQGIGQASRNTPGGPEKSSLDRRKLATDLIWNAISVGILAVCGFGLNIIIGRAYGPAVLGAFNQVYAVFILFSQLGAGGLQFSVLKYVSGSACDPRAVREQVSSALTLSSASGAAVAGLVFLLSGWLGRVLGSDAVTIGVRVMAPGILFFVLNKMLLAMLNGLRQMKPFAVFQAVRYLGMTGVTIVFSFLILPGAMLPLVFTVTEGVLLVILVAYCIPRLLPLPLGLSRTWLVEHLRFGGKAMASGMLSELNTRVDVLMLGLFATDHVVGIYSVSAMMAEGFVQLIMVVRTNINPLLTTLFARHETRELSYLIRQVKRISYVAAAVGGGVLMLIYPIAVRFLFGGESYVSGWSAFSVLCAGVMIAAGFLPFTMALVQFGLPGLHTGLLGVTVGVNVVLNVLLIPRLGMIGAALATALAMIAGAIALCALVRRYAQIRL